MGKIVAHAVGLPGLAAGDRWPICSWVVAHAYAEAGYYFKVTPGAATPDDIWDFCTERVDRYRLVRPLSPVVPPPEPIGEDVDD